MAEPARSLPAADDDLPSLDPAAIERAYRRERARRRALDERRNDARSSNARFFVVLSVLLFLTVFIGLTAWRQIETVFGL